MEGQSDEDLAFLLANDKDLHGAEAFVRSMTPEERRNPKSINGSRRARIANGSGVAVGEFAMFLTSRAAKTFTSTIGPPSGSGSGNGRFLLLTLTPDGRDAQAMFTCSEPEIPGP